MSYYERWFAWMLTTVVAAGDVTQAEIESGSPATGSPRKAVLRRAGGGLRRWSTGALRRGATSRSLHDSSRDSACARATFIHPGTRDCRVTRAARAASSCAITACFVFPDTNAHLRGEKPQHLYSVRFAARELWGEQASPTRFGSPATCGTTTSSRSDHMAAEPQPLAALPHLLRDEGGPVFAEPWQAQAFALAVKLSEQGHFTWKEWAAALAHELQAAANRGEPDDGSRYYEHWLAALERLVTAKGLADPAALVARKEAWTEAYRNTPHGRPVELPKAPARADGRWLLLGLASAVAAYWLVRATGQPFSGPQARFVASAGLGTLLGMRHALEPDHLAALSTLLTGERNVRKAAWLGRVLGDRSHADAAGGRHAPGGVAR